jgi:hypothetical protein
MSDYGMKQGERPSAIQFPANGAKAVDIPSKLVDVVPRSGRLEPKDGSPRDLTGQLNNGSNRQIRSMVIASDLDFKVKGVWENEKYFEAGVRVIEGIPETEEFELDFDIGDTANSETIDPDEVHLTIFMFNTEYAQFEPESVPFNVSKDVEESIESTSWQTVILQPSTVFDSENINFQNTGSNDLEYRFLTVNAGEEHQEVLDSSGNTVKTVSSGSNDYIFNKKPSGFVKLQAREKTGGNSSTLKAQFTGEA